MVAWELGWSKAFEIATGGFIFAIFLQLVRVAETTPAYSDQQRDTLRAGRLIVAVFTTSMFASTVVFSSAPVDAFLNALVVLVAVAAATYLLIGALITRAKRRYASRQGSMPSRDA